MSELAKPLVLYSPSEVQAEAHYCDAREICYGGTQGCGKTWWLRWDPIITQVYDWNGSKGEHTRYLEAQARGEKFESKGWALHLRRTYKDLEQTIQKVLGFIFKVDPGATYNSKTYTVKLTCGYRIQFGHCMNEDDWRDYDSNEYCVEWNTEVLMASGEYRAIRFIQEGDSVMTLEGPKKVTRFHMSGRKPCVEVSFPLLDGKVGTQIHPTTHPVLVSSSAQSPSGQCQSELLAGQRSPSPSFSWLDYESALCGLPESPAKRVSVIDAETGFAGFGGSRLEVEQLPELFFPLVLHEPATLQADARRPTPTECCECGSSCSRLTDSGKGCSPRSQCSLSDLSPSQEASESPPAGNEGNLACDRACARAGSGTAIGSTGSCPSCCRSHGERAHFCREDGRELPPQPTCAGSSTPKGSHLDVPERTRTCTGHSPPSYRHLYSGKTRQVTEGVRTVGARVRFHGWAETCDLTVEDANHYITRFGVVNSNSHIAFDEAIQFLKPQFNGIRRRLRCEDQVLNAKRRLCLATNPDAPVEGVWVKERYYDPAPDGRKMLVTKVTMSDGTEEEYKRIFFPAFLSDNPDQEFRKQTEIDLRTQPQHIMEARLFGRWDIVEGGFFANEWVPSVHVVKPFEIPAHWPKGRAMDWGYKKACPIMWFAKNEDDDLVIYREVTFNHNVTEMKRKDDQLVALAIKKIEQANDEWDDRRKCSKLTGPADYQICERRGGQGPTIEETMANSGVYWVKSTKNRYASTAELIRRLKDRPTRGGAHPAIMVFDTCENLKRIMPLIRIDKDDPEVPLKDDNGHWLETLMYICMYCMPKADKARRKGEDDDEDDELKAARVKRQASARAYGGYGS